MPKIEDFTPVPGMYPEDLQSRDGERKNPWSMLEDLAHDKPAYTVDDGGNYHYKQADAMNRFSDLVRQAQKEGDTDKADYYEYFMRNTLKNDPINITEEDFNRLSNDGKLNFLRLSGMQAKLNGDEETLRKCRQQYDELAQKPSSDIIDDGEYSLTDNSIDQRVHFGLSDLKARSLLVSAMEITPYTGYLPNAESIYNVFSHELPDDMERKEPVGYNEFGLSFFKKQMPDYNGADASLKELFMSKAYQAVASPCIFPQSEGGDKTLDEAMGFIHCIDPHKSGKYGGQDKVDCRLYLCPKPDNLIPIIGAFVDESEEADLPYYFKFCTSPNRNDKLVIYSNGDTVKKHLTVLEKIQSEHPEWFEGSGKNPLWGTIENVEGIYYGAEPLAIGKDSYGSRRARIFGNALSEWRQEFGVVASAQNYEELIKSENISDEQVRRFKALFADACRKEGITPQTFATAR